MSLTAGLLNNFALARTDKFRRVDWGTEYHYWLSSQAYWEAFTLTIAWIAATLVILHLDDSSWNLETPFVFQKKKKFLKFMPMKFTLQFIINLSFLQSISLFSCNRKHRGTQINLLEYWKGSILAFSYDFWHPFLHSMHNFLIHIHKSPIKDREEYWIYSMEEYWIYSHPYFCQFKIFFLKKKPPTKPICPIRSVKFCLLAYKKFVTSRAEFMFTKPNIINSRYVVYKIKLQHTS